MKLDHQGSDMLFLRCSRFNPNVFAIGSDNVLHRFDLLGIRYRSKLHGHSLP
jgi:hypothetical protein